MYTYQSVVMITILKQVAGIDVAQDELVVTLGQMSGEIKINLLATKTFRNDRGGFLALVSWVEKLLSKEIAVRYVMEATGVYHEKLAYFLAEKDLEISIVLPNMISNYFKTLAVKTVTDKTASQCIAQFGLERHLMVWKEPKLIYRQIRQLTRERYQLINERTMLKNQLHAEKTEAKPNAGSLKRMAERIKTLDEHEKEIKQDLADLIKTDPILVTQVKRICSIPGIGLLTAATILGETTGFDLIKNKKQLVSYSGLDIKEKESGTSVKGKARISKRGNRYLRKALHLPALTAINHNQRMKEVFVRLVSRHGIKMKAVVAIQRKMLELVYIIWKNETIYNPTYLKENA